MHYSETKKHVRSYHLFRPTTRREEFIQICHRWDISLHFAK